MSRPTCALPILFALAYPSGRARGDRFSIKTSELNVRGTPTARGSAIELGYRASPRRAARRGDERRRRGGVGDFLAGNSLPEITARRVGARRRTRAAARRRAPTLDGRASRGPPRATEAAPC